MGLGFTTIPDHKGIACYVLHRGHPGDVSRFERFSREVQRKTHHQVVLIDATSKEGEKVRTFYHIPIAALPTMLLVKDDDSLLFTWTATEIPSAEIVAHTMGRYGR